MWAELFELQFFINHFILLLYDNVVNLIPCFHFSTNLEELLYNLEYDTHSAIIWFENNYMKLNQDKCHFLISGNITEHLWTKVGDELIWGSAGEITWSYY